MTDELSRVVAHDEIAGGYRFLVFEAPKMAAELEPGQFVHVRVPALEPTALRRPFSVFDADGDRVTVLYKTVGRGTRALNGVRPGDWLEVEGPLGRGFPSSCGGTALLVGGGYGVAPLHFLAKRLAKTRGSAEDIILFEGGRTEADLLAREKFEALGVTLRLATNDGSVGDKGFVTVPLDADITRLKASGAAFELFTCGPDGLLKAVSDRALANGVPGWISIDRHMVCGVGACYACIQRTVHGNARCCIEGPVFRADELVW